MKKKISAVIGLLFFSSLVFGQALSVKWTEQMKYDNKVDGFFDDYLGTNSSFVYAKFSNLALSPKRRNDKIKLIAFEKNGLKKSGEVQLTGYGKDKEKKDLEYYQSIILENVIYVLWTKETNKTVELYAESFDNRLKKVRSLKKIYEITVNKKGTDNLIVIYNKDIGNKILVGKEFATTQDNENLKMEYKLINEDFSLSSSNQITLPIIVINKDRRDRSYNNLRATYELADDGKIYVQDMVKLDDEEKKKLKKHEASVYPVIMQIDPEKGQLRTYNIKFPDKNTFNFSTLVTKKGLKLFGFFCDLDKDPKGNDTHGIFCFFMDEKTFTPKETKFSYFDKKFLDQLFAADKENQKKGRGLFKSKEAKASDEESLDDRYVIEQVVEDGKDMVLFCSIMNNWKRTVCTSSSNGARTCNTYYYCTKNNVTAFKMGVSGDIIWASNLDRSFTYDRWNVYDLTVSKKDDNYYVVYGSAYQMNAKKKKMGNGKSRKQLTDRFEYAVFNGKTGDYRKSEHQVNTVNAKKAEKKYVDPANIYSLDNSSTMYTTCSRIRYKPTTFIACLCPPVFYFLQFSGNSRRGTGYLGAISPLN